MHSDRLILWLFKFANLNGSFDWGLMIGMLKFSSVAPLKGKVCHYFTSKYNVLYCILYRQSFRQYIDKTDTV